MSAKSRIVSCPILPLIQTYFQRMGLFLSKWAHFLRLKNVNFAKACFFITNMRAHTYIYENVLHHKVCTVAWYNTQNKLERLHLCLFWSKWPKLTKRFHTHCKRATDHRISLWQDLFKNVSLQLLKDLALVSFERGFFFYNRS